MTTEIFQATTTDDLARVFALRWKILREPWGFPRGSEQDPLDASAVHAAARHTPTGDIVAVARLHFHGPVEAQIRYMATEPACRNEGIAARLLTFLENHAHQHAVKRIFLHARDNACGFYEKCGYLNEGPIGHTFADIPHYRMSKNLEKPGQLTVFSDTRAGRWLRTREAVITTPNRQSCKWEFVSRTGTGGACYVVARIPGDEPAIVLVRQFRIPVQNYVIEFPAGLIDTGEDENSAALRELAEETGYHGKIVQTGPRVFNSPGLTDEWVRYFEVTVTGHTQTAHDPDEDIQVLLAPEKSLAAWLRHKHAKGDAIDAKLWSFAVNGSS